jgi:hypothetical protein
MKLTDIGNIPHYIYNFLKGSHTVVSGVTNLTVALASRTGNALVYVTQNPQSSFFIITLLSFLLMGMNPATFMLLLSTIALIAPGVIDYFNDLFKN